MGLILIELLYLADIINCGILYYLVDLDLDLVNFDDLSPKHDPHRLQRPPC